MQFSCEVSAGVIGFLIKLLGDKELQYISEISKFIIMHSAFLQLLNEDGWTEMYKGTKRRIFVVFFP